MLRRMAAELARALVTGSRMAQTKRIVARMLSVTRFRNRIRYLQAFIHKENPWGQCSMN